MNIKFPYSKKFLKAALAAALVAAPVVGTSVLVQPGQASAAAVAPAFSPNTATDTGSINISILQDDKKSVNTDSLELTVTNKSGTVVYTNSNVAGTATTNTNLAKGTYYVTISDGTVSQTTEVKVSTKAANAKLYWESTVDNGVTGLTKSASGVITKTGAMAGVVYNSTSDNATVVSSADVTVVSSNGKTKWTTKTNSNGGFKLFLPTGTYNVIVEGQDSSSQDDKKNVIYNKVKVSAGQTSLPLEQLNGSEAWGTGDKKLGFALDTTVMTDAALKSPATTKFVGSVLDKNNPVTVSIYSVTSSDTASADTVYTWEAEKVAKYNKTKNTNPFSISVKKNALAGKTIVFKVTDAAGNEYWDTKTYTIDQILAPTLTASAAKGTTDDTTKITVTPASGDTITLKVSNATITTPKVGDLAPTTGDTTSVVTKNYVTGTDVAASLTNKYVGIYEVDAQGRVVKFKLITLSSTYIK